MIVLEFRLYIWDVGCDIQMIILFYTYKYYVWGSVSLVILVVSLTIATILYNIVLVYSKKKNYKINHFWYYSNIYI